MKFSTGDLVLMSLRSDGIRKNRFGEGHVFRNGVNDNFPVFSPLLCCLKNKIDTGIVHKNLLCDCEFNPLNA